MAIGNFLSICYLGTLLFIIAGCGLKLAKTQQGTSVLGEKLEPARTITTSEREILYNLCTILRTKRNQLTFDIPNSVFFFRLSETKCTSERNDNEISANIRSSGSAPNQIFLWSSTHSGKYYSEFITDISSEMGKVCPQILEGDFIKNIFDWQDMNVGLVVAPKSGTSESISFFYTQKTDPDRKIIRWQKIVFDTSANHATLGMAKSQIEERQCTETDGGTLSKYHFEQNLL